MQKISDANTVSMTGVRRIKSKRNEVNKVMGGHILELESERLKRIGREEQRKEDEKIIAQLEERINELKAENLLLKEK